jgi:Leucine-rich repeat (LRR) protein
MKKSLLFILAGFLFSINSFGQAVATQDSLALVDFYNSTGGPNWSNHTNWLTTAPLITWYGVTVVNNRVNQLNLTGNNLEGSIPASLGNVSLLEGLVLIDNKLTGVIPSSLNNLVNLSQVHLEDNYYTFDGLEGLSTTKFAYNSQRTVFTIHNNNNLLSVSAGGTLANNTYTWYRYDSANNVIATKPHDSTFLATASGTYIVQIDNSLAPEADFFSDTLHVNVLPIVMDPLTIDSLALVDLYNSTNGAGWMHTTNWLTSAPISSWYGVTVQSGRVTVINLPYNNLQGSIPNSIGNLSALTELHLDHNKLNGNIPASVNNLGNVWNLVLNNNQLSGDLSPLGYFLSTRHDTCLYNNNFDFSSFEYVIDSLTKGLSPCTSCIGYAISPQTKLHVSQYFYGNSLSVSSGGILSENTYRWYNGNALVATNTGDSTYIYTTPGNYSVAVSNSKITQLTLNSDTVNVTIVPNWPDSLRQDSLALVDLYNSTNGAGWTNNTNWLTSAPLAEWSGVEIENGRVAILQLSGNNLTGNIPASLGNLTGLTQLLLVTNKLSGTIPASLGKLTNLIEFILEDNQLTGFVPSTLNNLSNCSHIELEDNEFNFDAFELATPKEDFAGQKTILQINNNNDTLAVTAGGTVSNNTYTWTFNNQTVSKTGDSTFVPILSGNYSVFVTNSVATTLYLYSHDLYVVVAPSLSQDSLALVDLYNSTNGANWINNNNWLTTAPINTWRGVTVTNGRVTGVNLSANNLAGSISSSIGNITALTTLNLNNNELDSLIPTSIGALANLSYLGLDSNQLSGSIPTSLDSLSDLVTLHLASNGLTGGIPELRDLSNIADLDLSANQLNGNIPSSIGTLSTLTSLHLSNNQLSGSIPSSFNGLSNLISLQLNDNELSSTIPAVNHLRLSNLNIANNQFTFAGIEGIIATSNNSIYSPQASIPVNKADSLLSVSVGNSVFNDTYNWYKDGTIISTKTGDSTFKPTSTGTYFATVTDTAATELTLQSNEIYVVVDSISIPPDSTNQSDSNIIITDTTSSIAAYPNPAHGVATVVFNTTISGQYYIQIESMSGGMNSFSEGTATAGQNIVYVNIENYPPGIYIITLNDANGKHNFKLSVK